MVSTKSTLACTVFLFAMASSVNAEQTTSQATFEAPGSTTSITTPSIGASGSGCAPSQSEEKGLPCVAIESTTAENLLEREEEAAMLI
jgi:hypothetical protein